MTSTRVCTVCTHPDRVAIDTAIAHGTASLRSVAIQHPPLSYGAVSRHSRDCVTVKATIERRREVEIGRASTEALAVATVGSIRDVARTQLDRSLEHIDELRQLWSDLAPQLRDESGKLKQLVDEDGNVNTALLKEALLVSKALREAGGADAFKWAELAAKIEGELQSGTQVNIQLNQQIQQVAPVLTAWVVDDLPAAVRAGLVELGLKGEVLDGAVAVLAGRLTGARGLLEARIAAVEDGGGATRR